MIGQHFLEDSLFQLRKLKVQADKALAQTRDADLVATLDPEANSIAAIMKHMAGNMRSRWTGFLTSDGEKPDRSRDDEFIVGTEMTRDALVAMWEDGWQRTFDAVASLTADDLGRSVRIRGEAHSVIEAINRQMTHYAAHVGQIVLLAKHYAGSGWTSLSIPRGQSKAVDVSKGGEPYAFKPR